MTYTLTALRYGDWVTCDFMPFGEKVRVYYSWGPSRTLPVEEARQLWAGLKRKGWIRHEPRVEF